MNQTCAFLSAFPCDVVATERLFSQIGPGSLAEEWRRSQPELSTHYEIVKSYLAAIPKAWNEVVQKSADLQVVFIPNATSKDLADSLLKFDVVVILAHHVQHSYDTLGDLECMDRVISAVELAAIAPTHPSIVHLGVCRSVGFTEILKARCDEVRVISSGILLDPIFFIRSSWITFQLWRLTKGDYADVYFKVRMELMDQLGVITN